MRSEGRERVALSVTDRSQNGAAIGKEYTRATARVTQISWNRELLWRLWFALQPTII
jgi:hypothetical protein